jgi:hypothetical protein
MPSATGSTQACRLPASASQERTIAPPSSASSCDPAAIAIGAIPGAASVSSRSTASSQDRWRTSLGDELVDRSSPSRAAPGPDDLQERTE